MARNPRKQIEREVERILDECKTRLLSSNNQEKGPRRAAISTYTRRAKENIIQAVRNFWPEDNDD